MHDIKTVVAPPIRCLVGQLWMINYGLGRVVTCSHMWCSVVCGDTQRSPITGCQHVYFSIQRVSWHLYHRWSLAEAVSFLRYYCCSGVQGELIYKSKVCPSQPLAGTLIFGLRTPKPASLYGFVMILVRKRNIKAGWATGLRFLNSTPLVVSLVVIN